MKLKAFSVWAAKVNSAFDHEEKIDPKQHNISSLISCHVPVHNMHTTRLTKAYQVTAIIIHFLVYIFPWHFEVISIIAGIIT